MSSHQSPLSPLSPPPRQIDDQEAKPLSPEEQADLNDEFAGIHIDSFNDDDDDNKDDGNNANNNTSTASHQTPPNTKPNQKTPLSVASSTYYTTESSSDEESTSSPSSFTETSSSPSQSSPASTFMKINAITTPSKKQVEQGVSCEDVELGNLKDLLNATSDLDDLDDSNTTGTSGNDSDSEGGEEGSIGGVNDDVDREIDSIINEVDNEGSTTEEEVDDQDEDESDDDDESIPSPNTSRTSIPSPSSNTPFNTPVPKQTQTPSSPLPAPLPSTSFQHLLPSPSPSPPAHKFGPKRTLVIGQKRPLGITLHRDSGVDGFVRVIGIDRSLDDVGGKVSGGVEYCSLDLKDDEANDNDYDNDSATNNNIINKNDLILTITSNEHTLTLSPPITNETWTSFLNAIKTRTSEIEIVVASDESDETFLKSISPTPHPPRNASENVRKPNVNTKFSVTEFEQLQGLILFPLLTTATSIQFTNQTFKKMTFNYTSESWTNEGLKVSSEIGGSGREIVGVFDCVKYVKPAVNVEKEGGVGGFLNKLSLLKQFEESSLPNNSNSNPNLVQRKVVVFSSPSILLILRRPTNLFEVSNLSGLELMHGLGRGNGGGGIGDFWVTEEVLVLGLCRIRVGNGVGYSGDGDVEEGWFSIEDVGNKKVGGGVILNSVDFSSALQTSVVEALYSVHSPTPSSKPTEHERNRHIGWKHGILHGTIHSFVYNSDISGLENEIKRLIEIEYNHDKGDDDDDGVDAPKQTELEIALNDYDSDGYQPIHLASLRMDLDIIRILCKHGCDATLLTKPSSSSLPRVGLSALHLFALNLDYNTLSLILSTSAHPNPNVVSSGNQSQCNTPMAHALLCGRSIGGSVDYVKLEKTVKVLEVWGGGLIISPTTKTAETTDSEYEHPINQMASNWKFNELKIGLESMNLDNSVVVGGETLGKSMGYPLHSCVLKMYSLISEGGFGIFLKDRIVKVEKEEWIVLDSTRNSRNGSDDDDDDGVDDDDIEIEMNDAQNQNPLLLTLKILVNSGVEVNERNEQGLTVFQLLSICGVTQLNLTPGNSNDEDNDNYKSEESESKAKLKMVSAVGNMLLSHGARHDIPFTPVTIPPSPSSPLFVKVPGNYHELTSPLSHKLYGGIDRMQGSRTSFTSLHALNTKTSTKLKIRKYSDKEKKDLLHSSTTLTNDNRTCASCASVFGMFKNKRHMCNSSRRWFCDGCSSKRVIVSGSDEVRVCDSVFNRVRYLDLCESERVKKEEVERIKHFEQEKVRLLEESSSKSKGKSNAKTNANKKGGEKEELFGNIGKFFTGVVGGAVDGISRGISNIGGDGDEEGSERQRRLSRKNSKTELSPNDKMASTASVLNQTKDRLNERGEKLNELGDKTARLVNQGSEFARMAKLLEKQQKGNFFGF